MIQVNDITLYNDNPDYHYQILEIKGNQVTKIKTVKDPYGKHLFKDNDGNWDIKRFTLVKRLAQKKSHFPTWW